MGLELLLIQSCKLNVERLRSLILGLSVWSWAVLGIVAVDPAERTTAVRLSLCVLNILIGTLFLVRRPIVKSGSNLALVLCVPSFVVGGLAFKLAPSPSEWPVHASALFTAGTCFVVVSFLSLGRCFAILPAVRGTVRHGPYRLVRHPVYAGECLMLAACFLALPSWTTACPLLAAIPCLVVRILAEERLLIEQIDYRDYAARVTWRLVPGIW